MQLVDQKICHFFRKLDIRELFHVCPKNDGSSQLWICSQDFLKCSQWQGPRDRSKLYCFPKISLALGKWAILNQKIMCCHNSQHALTTFLNNLHSENGLEVHGNYVNGFSEKNYSFA